MFDFFYRYLLNKKIKRTLNASYRQREFLNLQTVKTVLILFETKDYNAVCDLSSMLQQAGKHIITVAYSKKSEEIKHKDKANYIITEKDINIDSSKSLSNIKNNLSSITFDLAVDMTVKNNLLMQYIMVSSNALLKVGFHECEHPIYDMLILSQSGENSEIHELGKQMIYYLSTIGQYTSQNN
ncbi:MAG: hypothetical protein LBJ17_03800 [Dysgonamonadaceae bacterium]|jgi:hypothetical protein|nr:hypothetical protein [Dysgonamonadaceae bacterium]